MERIDIETISYIAKLAKLRFTKEEAEEFANEFQGILGHFRNIDNEDLSNADEQSSEEKKAVFREDKVSCFKDKKELFQNTKEMKEGYISIPKVIE